MVYRDAAISVARLFFRYPSVKINIARPDTRAVKLNIPVQPVC